MKVESMSDPKAPSNMVEPIQSVKAFQKKDDPKDQRIRDLIKEHVFSTPLGEQMMKKCYDLEVSYYKDSLEHLAEPLYIFQKHQELLRALAEATNSQIIHGEEYLEEVPEGKAIFSMVNHFSAYKLTSIEQSILGLKISEIDDVPPPPMHFAAVYPVAERLGLTLHDAHLELPEPLGTIQKAEGFIGVPRMKGQFDTILERSKLFTSEYPDSMTVIFPEGGTSGKENNAGPFDLLPFHKGTFVIAAKLGIPVLPTAQYFNPKSGFEIGVFKPFTPEANLSVEQYAEMANDVRSGMQTWLDSRKAS